MIVLRADQFTNMYLLQLEHDEQDDDEEMSPSSPLIGRLAPKDKPTSSIKVEARKGTEEPSSEQEDAIMDDLTETEDEDGNGQADNIDPEVQKVDEGEEEESEEEEEDEYVADDDDDDDDEDDDDYEEEWRPSKNSSSKSANRKSSSSRVKTITTQSSNASKRSQVPNLERDLEDLSIGCEAREDLDESVIILPKKTKKVKKIVIDSDSEDVQKVAEDEEDDEVPSVPVVKKKR